MSSTFVPFLIWCVFEYRFLDADINQLDERPISLGILEGSLAAIQPRYSKENLTKKRKDTFFNVPDLTECSGFTTSLRLF